VIWNRTKVLVRYVLMSLIRFLSYVIPKNKTIWVFNGFADKYVDNSKYLYEFIFMNHCNITPIWITRNKETFEKISSIGYNVRMKRSISGFYYSLIAKIHFYGDYVDYWTSGGAICVNLWHGTPLKKIEFDIKNGPLKGLYDGSALSYVQHPELYIKPDYMVSSSTFFAENAFCSAFRIQKSRCLNYGYPRNDILFNNKIELLMHIENEMPKLYNTISGGHQYRTIYLYLPTWRDSGSNLVEDSGIDFQALNTKMEQLNSLFLLKFHPATHINIDITRFSNIMLINNNTDLYKLIPLTDVLVTDYSSVYFDYLLLNKRIIFFPFDYDEYIEHRELYFNYDEITPGIIVHTFEELLLNLDKQYLDTEKYTNIRNKAWNYLDNNSSSRIVNYFAQKTGVC